MDFGLTDEQAMIVDTTRAFVETELYPHEAEIEETGVLRHDLRDKIKAKAIEAGIPKSRIEEAAARTQAEGGFRPLE